MYVQLHRETHVSQKSTEKKPRSPLCIMLSIADYRSDHASKQPVYPVQHTHGVLLVLPGNLLESSIVWDPLVKPSRLRAISSSTSPPRGGKSISLSAPWAVGVRPTGLLGPTSANN